MFNKITLLAVSAILLAACSMDPILTSSYPEDIAWKSKENAQMYANQFYPLIGSEYYYSDVENDAFSDILKPNSPIASQNLIAYGATEIVPEQNYFSNWEWGHTWAIACCRFIENLHTMGEGLPEDTRNELEAQIRWFRAKVYFEMARRFGGCVVIHRTLPDINEKEHPLCTPDQCWDFIAEDLDYAAEHLQTVADAGRLTKGAAYALKARAMLYAERWRDAIDACDEVDKLGLYGLEADYGKLFLRKRSSGTSPESIVEYGFSYPTLYYSFDKFYCPPLDGGYAQISPTDELVSQYQMADGRDFDWNDPEMRKNPYLGREPRFYASILYHGATWKGRVLDIRSGSQDGFNYGGGTTSTGYYMRKLFDPSQTTGFTGGDLTYYCIRYAEILLIKAEAEAMVASGGDFSAALAPLNKVRERAGFTTPLSTNNKDEFMKFLRHERMIELAFEGHRFWDLRRWNLAEKTLNNVHWTGIQPVNDGGEIAYVKKDADNGKVRHYPAKYARFPIPLSEVQRNPKIDQFPEWI